MNTLEKDTSSRRKNGFSPTLLLVLLGGLSLIITLLFFISFYQHKIGPEQPIPFSHRVHATNKHISCVFCHDQVTRAAVAGVPPLETCYLCHSRIIVHHPQIEKVRQAFKTGKPIHWKKVTYLPDFVYFNHSVHINRQIDCGHCHGNVKKMDRIYLYQELKMGFCIQCHRDNQASTDCFTCHR